MQVISIKWIDAAYSDGTYDKDELKDFKTLELLTVGWLLEEREDSYLIAAERFGNRDRFKYLHTIPKSGIVEVIKLGEVKFSEWG